MKICLTFNLKKGDSKDRPEDFYAEYDTEETINEIKEAIEVNGHEVILIEADEDAYTKLSRKKIDFVFNFAEGVGKENRESEIPRHCEKLNIPYLGPKPETCDIILNKAGTKHTLTKNKIPTPKFQVMNNETGGLNKDLSFPLLVKPLAEGSSKGLKNENLVKNEQELKRIVKKIRQLYNQASIVEEFLDGKEFTVSVIGNENPFILPIVETKFDYLPEGINKFDSYEAKWIYDSPEFIEKHKVIPIVCPAEIDRKMEQEIKEIALKTFKVLECRDWARIDIRLDKDGIPNILEVNTPAGLLKDPKENSRMPKAAYALGWTYEKLIAEILDAGLKRYG